MYVTTTNPMTWDVSFLIYPMWLSQDEAWASTSDL